MFELQKNSLAFAGGHSDELSFQTCKLLLGNPGEYQVVEIIYGKQAVFTQHCIFTLGGAHYRNITLNGHKIEQNKVYEANQDDILIFEGLELGFRLYLVASPFDKRRVGCSRTKFDNAYMSSRGKIRVIKGPEYSYLDDPEALLEGPFTISANSDLGGLRLEGEKITANKYDIASAIVDDGIIQLTANGPIVLLRERQVTGGYPRILSVIQADLDTLAQYRIGEVVRFELIELTNAKALLLQREKEFTSLAASCLGI